MKTIHLTMMLSLMLVVAGGAVVHANVIRPDLQAVLESAAPDQEIDIILSFIDKVNLKAFQNPANKGLQRAHLVTALKGKSQANIKSIQHMLAIPAVRRSKALWAIHGAALTAQAETIQVLARHPNVESIRLDAAVNAPAPAPDASSLTGWNLSTIGVPELWNQGIYGTGVVVASMDTGVDETHPDLAGSWRGGSNSWFDPHHEHDSDPYDKSGHGTQVMGVMVGGDTSGTAIGVAPGAQWIAVKIFNDAGLSSYSVIHQGFQWLLDPDNDPDTDDAPDIVNNSWNLNGSDGQCVTEFAPDILAMRAAQIAVVFSGGNAGPDPDTSESPANNDGSFAVGAVDQYLYAAEFSSCGPSACDGDPYPETVAPGVNVKTTDLSGGYANYINVSGTSIAAPHVSGAMALLLEAHPNASVSELEQALSVTALDLGETGPDDVFGSGLVDVAAAKSWLDNPTLPTCSDVDGDGFFAEAGCSTAVDCNDFDDTINPDACDIKGDGIDQDCDGIDRTKGKPCPGIPVDDGGDTGDTSGVEGKGKTCSDGIDNDGDGAIDCGDADCASNKACK